MYRGRLRRRDHLTDLRTSLGGLSCRVLQQALPGTRIDLAVVLCHGFGAPGGDLVSLAPELCRARPELAQKVRFVFPEAPLSLRALGYGEGCAWWPLDFQRLAALQSGNASVARLRREVPEGLPRARRLLTGLIEELTLQTQLPIGRVVIGGFSQGAMLATDVALRLEEAPAGLVIFSGMLLNEVEWARRAPIRRGLYVLQAHGRQDPLLPFSSAEALCELLVFSGLSVDFLDFEAGHTIPFEGVKRLGDFLATTLDR